VVVRAGVDLGYAELLEYDRPTGGRLAMALGATLLAGLVAWVLVEVVARRAVERGADRSARRLRLGLSRSPRAWVLPGAVAMVGATISTDGYDVIWGDPPAASPSSASSPRWASPAKRGSRGRSVPARSACSRRRGHESPEPPGGLRTGRMARRSGHRR